MVGMCVCREEKLYKTCFVFLQKGTSKKFYYVITASSIIRILFKQ